MRARRREVMGLDEITDFGGWSQTHSKYCRTFRHRALMCSFQDAAAPRWRILPWLGIKVCEKRPFQENISTYRCNKVWCQPQHAICKFESWLNLSQPIECCAAVKKHKFVPTSFLEHHFRTIPEGAQLEGMSEACRVGLKGYSGGMDLTQLCVHRFLFLDVNPIGSINRFIGIHLSHHKERNASMSEWCRPEWHLPYG